MLKYFPKKIFSNLKSYSEYHLYSRQLFIRVSAIIGLPLVTIFSLQDLYQGEYVAGGFGIAVFLILCFLVFDSNRKHDLQRSCFLQKVVVRLFLSIFIFYFLYILGVEESLSRSLWILIFPVLIFSITNHKEGLIWAICASAVLIPLLFQANLSFCPDELFHFKTRFLAIFGIFLSVNIVTTIIIRSAIQNLIESKKEIHTTNLKLNKEIKERKLAETSLKYSKRQFEVILDNLDSSIYIVDVELNRILFVNEHMKKVFGNELIGKTCWESIYNCKDGPCEFCTNDRLTDASGNPSKPYVWEMYNKKMNRWYQMHDQMVPWIDGQLVRMAVAVDLTDRKKTEKALYESEIKNKALQEATFEALFFSEKGICIEANSSANKMFGYKAHEFIGIFCTDVIAKDFKDIVANKIFSGYDKPYEALAQRKDGSQFWAEFHGKMFTYKGRKIRVTSVRDITDQKKLQEEVLKSHKLESLGTLASGIAHDFNNLLYVVMGNISLARDGMAPGFGPSENLKEAENACIRAKELSARLITFSKGGNPVKEMMPIKKLLKETVMSVLREFNTKSEIIIADAVRQVNIDEGQIKQVIRNIVVNAKEAMNGNGHLIISCKNIDIAKEGYLTLNQGKYIKISFKDQGCGISKEDQKKIFDPYFSTKEMGIDKGQGLGLTVSYSIVQKHGGLIDVKSELESGSTFSVYLPAFHIKEPSLQNLRETHVEHECVGQPASGTGKILLMDDEESVRIFMGKLLGRLGYEVETCIEGKEAIERYKEAMESKEPFNVVILDLTNQYGMGGQEAMRRLLEIDNDAKGIVITGYFNDPVVSNFRAYGFSGFLTKPSTKDELSKVIEKVLSSSLNGQNCT